MEIKTRQKILTAIYAAKAELANAALGLLHGGEIYVPERLTIAAGHIAEAQLRFHDKFTEDEPSDG